MINDPDGPEADKHVDHANSLLGQVFMGDERSFIEEEHENLFEALERIESDYDKLCEASSDLEASQNAVGAFALVITLEGTDDVGDDDDARGPDTDDPDADLDGDE